MAGNEIQLGPQPFDCDTAAAGRAMVAPSQNAQLLPPRRDAVACGLYLTRRKCAGVASRCISRDKAAGAARCCCKRHRSRNRGTAAQAWCTARNAAAPQQQQQRRTRLGATLNTRFGGLWASSCSRVYTCRGGPRSDSSVPSASGAAPGMARDVLQVALHSSSGQSTTTLPRLAFAGGYLMTFKQTFSGSQCINSGVLGTCGPACRQKRPASRGRARSRRRPSSGGPGRPCRGPGRRQSRCRPASSGWG